jgi:hypothetical protein
MVVTPSMASGTVMMVASLGPVGIQQGEGITEGDEGGVGGDRSAS